MMAVHTGKVRMRRREPINLEQFDERRPGGRQDAPGTPLRRTVRIANVGTHHGMWRQFGKDVEGARNTVGPDQTVRVQEHQHRRPRQPAAEVAAGTEANIPLTRDKPQGRVSLVKLIKDQFVGGGIAVVDQHHFDRRTLVKDRPQGIKQDRACVKADDDN